MSFFNTIFWTTVLALIILLIVDDVHNNNHACWDMNGILTMTQVMGCGFLWFLSSKSAVDIKDPLAEELKGSWRQIIFGDCNSSWSPS